jgi:hypothetical protein
MASTICPLLMIGLPLFAVLRFGWLGILIGGSFFWLAALIWTANRWYFHGLYDAALPILGLPGGFIYSAIIWAVKAFIDWGIRRIRARTIIRPLSLWTSLVIVAILTALIWHARPYGMGTSAMIQNLKTCSENQIVFFFNEPWYFHNFGQVDLAKGTFSVGGSDESDNEIGQVTLTCGGASVLETSLSTRQLSKIKELVASIPSQHKFVFDRYDFKRSIYLGLWRKGRLQTLEFRRDDMPDELKEFLGTLSPRVLSAVQNGLGN